MSSRTEELDLSAKRRALEQELRQWWQQRNEDWGSGTEENTADGDLWDDTPEIDSKEVAKAGSRCEKHIDGEFDPSMIREGGYDSIDDVIDHLVPKMVEQSQGE